ncbi:MAG: MaoC family dehydratase N-terminal domain-containing protein [Dehalococcoidia bacterium]
MVRAELEYNEGVLGKEYETGTYRITRELIADFVEAVGETNPLFADEEAASRGPFGGIIAPPALPNILVDDWEPPELGLKFEGVLYLASHWVEPLAPIRPGDVLKATSRVVDVYAKTGRSGPMAFVVMETTLTNQEGVQVARVGRSNVRRR